MDIGGIFSSFLTPGRKKDLLGLFMLVLGVLTLINLLPSQQGPIGGAWIGFLKRLFGWGMFVIPIVLSVIGLRMILRRLQERLPSLDQEQVIGLLLLYWLALTSMHALLGAMTWEQGIEFARAGWGGGLIGAATFSLLIRSLGIAGSVVILIAWALIAVTFTAGISVPEFIALILQSWGRIRDQFTRIPVNQTKSSPQSFRPTTRPERTDSDGAAPAAPVETAAVKQDEHEESIQEAEPIAWELPGVDQILKRGAVQRADEAFDRERAKLIEETLVSFGAPAKVVEINRGPVITQFGVEPSFVEGRGGRRTKVKVSKISALADDLALALAAPSIRIEAPVPGKGFIGIEVPN
ncbi:MAG: DNA translocase FtsK 4TM domain-containing protein, partial [Anaerolineales bacterium]